MNADDYRKLGMAQARKTQEAPLRMARGRALLALLDAKTGDARQAARAALAQADEQLRTHGFQP